MTEIGKFITLEGGEGAGKSTHARLLAEKLGRNGFHVVETHEPGGTPGAELVRHLLKSGAIEPLGTFAETVMISAARDDHLEEVIRPALESGQWVISDRFADSTRAYQGAGSGLEPELLNALERTVVGDDEPDLTLLLDLPVATSMRRTRKRAKDAGKDVTGDRFEQQGKAFHEKLRKAFLDMAENNPDRFIVIDAGKDRRQVSRAIWKAVKERLLDD